MRGCIFDLDGTLTNTLESLTYSVNLTLKEMELPSITMDQCRRFVGDGARKLIERTLEACGDRSLSRLDEGMEIYGRIFHDNCTYHVTPYDGVMEMLADLRSMGMRLAVLSNKPHGQAVERESLTLCRGRARSCRESLTRPGSCTCWTRWASKRRSASTWATRRWTWLLRRQPV